MNRLDYLFQRMLNNTATPAELEELYQLILVIDPAKASIFKPYEDNENETARTRPKDREVLEKLFPEILSKVNIHEKPDTIIPITRYSDRSRWWLGAAAAIIVLAIGTVWYNASILNEGIKTEQTAELKKQEPAIFSFKGPDFVRLPDNTSVTLHEGSELTYSSLFGESTREVSLTGEAFFDVTHDPDHKFIVTSGKIITSVLGTAFNVKALPGDNNVTVTVTRGKVSVANTDHTFGTITPNEQIAVNTDTFSYVKKIVNTDNVIAWKSEFIIIDDQSFEDAVKFIATKYKVKITLANEDLKKCRITSKFFEKTELKLVLKAISTVANATYTIDGNGGVTISGEGCK